MSACISHSTFRVPARLVLLLTGGLLVLSSLPAAADLENVVVGGEIRVRGNWWMSSFNAGDKPLLVRLENRWPADTMTGRPIGSALGVGGQNLYSYFDWDSRGPDYAVVEQRTTFNVRADFTQGISAYVELDSFDAWGENFRSNYLTGVDKRANSADDVEIYQAYIEADNVLDMPLRLRIGRQELVFGDGWLLGNNSAMPEFTGLSFDAVRATYTEDMFTLDAFWGKLAELSPLEEDGDTDFYGVYASYKGIEKVTLDAFWFWLRDAERISDTQSGSYNEWLGNLLGLGDYGPTNLHTVGLRAAGTLDGFDFALNAAYQFGDASRVGALFKPYIYGDNKADFDSWAGDIDLGYTFDLAWKPRIHVAAAYVGGEDNRSISFGDWSNPLSPWVRPNASVSFNRLFSNTVYSYFFDEMGELSNFWMVRGGVSAHPAESIEAGLNASYFGVIDTFDRPLYLNAGSDYLLLARGWSFLTQESSDDLGWELDLWVKYHYSPDLTFEAGWSHLFTGDGLAEGNFNDMNGLLFNGGTAKDDADYLYFQTTLRF